jgi:hypothetical protein
VNEFQIKVKIPIFNGDLDIEEFFDWIAECDRLRNTKVHRKEVDETILV